MILNWSNQFLCGNTITGRRRWHRGNSGVPTSQVVVSLRNINCSWTTKHWPKLADFLVSCHHHDGNNDTLQSGAQAKHILKSQLRFSNCKEAKHPGQTEDAETDEGSAEVGDVVWSSAASWVPRHVLPPTKTVDHHDEHRQIGDHYQTDRQSEAVEKSISGHPAEMLSPAVKPNIFDHDG